MAGSRAPFPRRVPTQDRPRASPTSGSASTHSTLSAEQSSTSSSTFGSPGRTTSTVCGSSLSACSAKRSWRSATIPSSSFSREHASHERLGEHPGATRPAISSCESSTCAYPYSTVDLSREPFLLEDVAKDDVRARSSTYRVNRTVKLVERLARTGPDDVEHAPDEGGATYRRPATRELRGGIARKRGRIDLAAQVGGDEVGRRGIGHHLHRPAVVERRRIVDHRRERDRGRSAKHADPVRYPAQTASPTASSMPVASASNSSSETSQH